MKKLLGLAMASMALIMFIAPTAFAAEFIHSNNESGNITLSNGENHRNLYIAGGSVFINSNTAGDLYAAGGNVIVEGSVEQDAVIAGGTVTINGQIGGDIRIAGGNITINAPVGGDIIMAGGTLHLTEKATVAGDLIAKAGEITVEGAVAGTVKLDAGMVTLNSSLPGNVKVTAGQTFEVGNKAIIPSSITYKGIHEASVQDGAKIGTVNFEQFKEHRGGEAGRIFAGLFTVVFIIKVIGLILAGLLLMKLFPRTGRAAVESMQRGMWTNLGIGAITLILGPIAFLILLVTFFGLYIAILWLLAWLIMLFVSALVTCIFVGAWIIKMLTKKDAMVYDWQALVIGVVAVGILTIIPFIGGLIFVLLLMTAFGGIMRQMYARIQKEQDDVDPKHSLAI